MFGSLFKSKKESTIGSLQIITRSDNLVEIYEPREFLLIHSNTELPPIYFLDKVGDAEYTEGLSKLQHIVSKFYVSIQKDNAQIPTTKDTLEELFKVKNALIIHNRPDVLERLFSNDLSSVLVRLYELDTLIKLFVDPDVLLAIKTRCTLQMYYYQISTTGSTDINNLYDFITENPWYYIILPYRLSELI